MDIDKLKKGCFYALICYMVLAVTFYLVAGEQLRFKYSQTDTITPAQPVGEIVQGVEVRQPFVAQADELLSLSLRISTYGRDNSCHLQLAIVNDIDEILACTEISGQYVIDNTINNAIFAEPVQLKQGENYSLVISSPDGAPGNALTVWFGNTVTTARLEIAKQIAPERQLLLNGQPLDGELHCQMNLGTYLWYGDFYWFFAGGLGILLAAYCLYLLRAVKNGRSSIVLRLIAAFQRYDYLLRQLIARDFKTKYKRSILGVFWSFLNPLLTMSVQYVVFSTLFKSDIPNFALYLLIGIVCFNFFSEAVGMALTSIVGNAALITKVYVPKYIYPVSRVLSSTVNLLLSLIPLFAVMLFTGAAVRPALLLLPFGLFCLLVFSLGVGMFLATTMVFFRDTQFLWGVVSMLWMYITPIFYPESIIPDSIMPLYKCNPLYHIVRFIRIIMMDGVSPEPKAYCLCLLVSFIPLLLGAFIFKKQQDKFVLNL